MNRQLTLRLLGILVAAIPIAVWVSNSYQRKAAEVTADPQAFLAHQTALAKTGAVGLYLGAVFTVAGICALVELTARIVDWVLPMKKGDERELRINSPSAHS